MRIGSELVKFVEQCYETAVTNPDGTRDVIKAELQQHQAALTANAADYAVGGLQFLDLCLSPDILRFEMPCECLSLPQPHCYYDHLYLYFFRYMIAAMGDNSVPLLTSLLRYEPKMNSGTPELDLIVEDLCTVLFTSAFSLNLIATCSMAITLRPFFDIVKVVCKKNIALQDLPVYFRSLESKKLSKSIKSFYVRLATDFLPEDRLNMPWCGPCIPFHLNNQPPYITQALDLRGSQFEKTSLCDKFINVNLSDTVWVGVRLDGVSFENCWLKSIRYNNCQFERVIYNNCDAGFGSSTPNLQSPLSFIAYLGSCYFPRQAQSPLPSPSFPPSQSYTDMFKCWARSCGFKF